MPRKRKIQFMQNVKDTNLKLLLNLTTFSKEEFELLDLYKDLQKIESKLLQSFTSSIDSDKKYDDIDALCKELEESSLPVPEENTFCKEDTCIEENSKDTLITDRILIVLCIRQKKTLAGYKLVLRYNDLKLCFGPYEDLEFTATSLRDEIQKVIEARESPDWKDQQTVSDWIDFIKAELDKKYALLTQYKLGDQCEDENQEPKDESS